MAQVALPFAQVRIIPGTDADDALRDVFERGVVGPFALTSRDGDESIYEPCVRITARVVKASEVLYWVRIER